MQQQMQRKRRRLNLRTRFLVVFIGIIAGLTVLIAAVAGYRFVNDMESLIERNGRSITETFEKLAFFSLEVLFSSGGVESENGTDTSDLNRFLESTVSGSILYGQVVHNGVAILEKVVFNGEEIEDKSSIGINLPPIHVDPGKIIITRGELSDGEPYMDFLGTFEGKDPPPGVIPEQVDSYVRIGINMGQFQREVQQTISGVVLISLGAILLGAVLMIVYYQRTWKPLEVINNALQQFGRGENDVRARVDTGDELETLALSFNEMANSIVKKDEQMYQVNLEMQRANRAKSDFLASMSHDLKTPLHVISGYAQLMLEGDGGKPSDIHHKHLSAMVRSSDRLLEFIERILNFSKIESGEEPLELELVQVAKITEEAVEPLISLANRKNLALQVSVETNATICADLGKLKQVLSNLIENAIKYTDEGKINVRVYEQDGGILWSVQDTGPGIPNRFESFIFEPFGRLEDSQIKITEGIGLGLAIVKRYVERHQGQVAVRSTPGQGSTFTVFIPKEAESDEHSDC
jgi:signal transduction histidine kinase